MEDGKCIRKGLGRCTKFKSGELEEGMEASSVQDERIPLGDFFCACAAARSQTSQSQGGE